MRRAVAIVSSLVASALVVALPAGGAPIRAPYHGAVKANKSAARVLLLLDQPYALDGSPAHTFDAYLPADGETTHPGIVLIHGGGWSHGSKQDLAGEARYFALHGFDAFSINYRLAPRHRWPAQLLDAEAAVVWLRTYAPRYALDPNRIGAFGPSAGGHLASFLAVLTNGNPDRGAGVKAAVAWSAPMDLRLLIQLAGAPSANSKKVFACGSTAECESLALLASPIHYVSRDDANLFFVHAKWERMSVKVAREMDSRMKQVHARHVYVELPTSKHARGYQYEDVPGTSTTVLDASLDFFSTYL